jgi:D-3-phosphoglycerate dehydrogenase
MKVLANDGISKVESSLRKGGFEVITTKVAQEQVANFVNENNVDVVLVRSATKVRKDIIDACPGLKLLVVWRGMIILRCIAQRNS